MYRGSKLRYPYSLGSRRKRFAIAYGIGQYLYYSEPFECEDFIENDRRKERANRYATRLLIPQWMIFAIGREIGSYAPSRLAPRFDVPTTAVLYRLKKMGVL